MDSAASAHQRKIELQSPEDLTYLLANVRRAAAERLDEAFPPVDGAQGEDELRTRIEELVNEVRGRILYNTTKHARLHDFPFHPCSSLPYSDPSPSPLSVTNPGLSRPLRSTSPIPSRSPRPTCPSTGWSCPTT
jgi:kinetochor protein Mis14/NSL1